MIDKIDSLKEIFKRIDSTIIREAISKFEEGINSRDFYHESYAKYLLLRIEFEKVDQENFQGYGGVITIEHILPQNSPEYSE